MSSLVTFAGGALVPLVPWFFRSGFTAQAGEAVPSIIVSESTANKLWPGENPVGHTLRLGTGGLFHDTAEPLPDGPVWRVIGVARDTRGVLLDGSDTAPALIDIADSVLNLEDGRIAAPASTG